MEKPNKPMGEKLICKIRIAKDWAIQHKSEIILGVTVVTAVVIGVVAWNNKEIIIKSIHKVKPALKPATPNTIPMATPIQIPSVVTQVPTVSPNPVTETVRTVCEHSRSGGIRNLHEGWKASIAKIAEAAEKGILLEEGQTLVNSCTVNSKCA